MCADQQQPFHIRYSAVSNKLDYCNCPCMAQVFLYSSWTGCTLCWMLPLGTSTHVGRQSAQFHCFSSFTGYASTTYSVLVVRSGVPAFAWHSTSILVRHLRSLPVALCIILTSQHCRCHRLVEQLLAMACFWQLNNEYGMVYLHRQETLIIACWHFGVRWTFVCFVWRTALTTDCLHWSRLYKLCCTLLCYTVKQCKFVTMSP